MATLTSPDFSKLPPPDLIKILDPAVHLEDIKTCFQTIIDEDNLGITVTDFPDKAPISKMLKVLACRELALRQRINNAARQCLLVTATGTNLDQIAALFNTPRLELDPGDPEASPPIDPTFEDDDALRRRAQNAFVSLTGAGPRASYEFHAKSAQYDCSGIECTTAIIDEAHTFAADELLNSINLERTNVELSSITVKSSDGSITYNVYDGTLNDYEVSEDEETGNAIVTRTPTSDGGTILARATVLISYEAAVTDERKTFADDQFDRTITLDRPDVSSVSKVQSTTERKPVVYEQGDAADYTVNMDENAVYRVLAPDGDISPGETVQISYDARISDEKYTFPNNGTDLTINLAHLEVSNVKVRHAVVGKEHDFSASAFTLDHTHIENLSIESLNCPVVPYSSGNDYTEADGVVTRENGGQIVEGQTVGISYDTLTPVASKEYTFPLASGSTVGDNFIIHRVLWKYFAGGNPNGNTLYTRDEDYVVTIVDEKNWITLLPDSPIPHDVRLTIEYKWHPNTSSNNYVFETTAHIHSRFTLDHSNVFNLRITSLNKGILYINDEDYSERDGVITLKFLSRKKCLLSGDSVLVSYDILDEHIATHRTFMSSFNLDDTDVSNLVISPISGSTSGVIGDYTGIDYNYSATEGIVTRRFDTNIPDDEAVLVSYDKQYTEDIDYRVNTISTGEVTRIADAGISRGKEVLISYDAHLTNEQYTFSDSDNEDPNSLSITLDFNLAQESNVVVVSTHLIPAEYIEDVDYKMNGNEMKRIPTTSSGYNIKPGEEVLIDYNTFTEDKEYSFDADDDFYRVTLQHPPDVLNVAILSNDSTMTYRPGKDYTLDANAGIVTRVNGGGITNGDTVLIGYDAHTIAEGEEARERVKDVSVTSPSPGAVEVTILSDLDILSELENAPLRNGRSSDGLRESVSQVLHEKVPVTDQITVKKPKIIPYKIVAEVSVDTTRNPNTDIQQTVIAGAKRFIAENHYLGQDITSSTLYSALTTKTIEATDDNTETSTALQAIPGWKDLNIISPTADIIVADDEAPFCDPNDEENPNICIKIIPYQCTGTECTIAIIDEAHTLTDQDIAIPIYLAATKVSNVVVNGYSANTDYVENAGVIMRVPDGSITIGNLVLVSFDVEVDETVIFSASNNPITLSQTVLSVSKVESARTSEQYHLGSDADYTVSGSDITRTPQSRIVEDEEVLISYVTQTVETDETATFSSDNNPITLGQTVVEVLEVKSVSTSEQYHLGSNADYTVSGSDIIRTALSEIADDETLLISYVASTVDQQHTFTDDNVGQGFFIRLAHTDVKQVKVTSYDRATTYDYTLYAGTTSTNDAVTLIDAGLSSGDTVLISYDAPHDI